MSAAWKCSKCNLINSVSRNDCQACFKTRINEAEFIHKKNNDNNNDDNMDDNKNNMNATPLLYPLPHKDKARWQKILPILKKPIKDTSGLLNALYSFQPTYPDANNATYEGLETFLTEYMSDNELKQLFNNTLPFIQQCAANLPTLFPTQTLSLLYSGKSGSVDLTEHQIASLLAMSFLGLNTYCSDDSFPHFNITNLFVNIKSVYFEKIRCILNYFYSLSIKPQYPNNTTRIITIYRHLPSNDDYVQLKNQNLKQNATKLCEFDFNISGCIEDCSNSLQIDFANKYIGGGVLGRGCVMEEIRFLMNTECMVSLLFCQVMNVNESIAIIGSKQYSKYKGYGSKRFKYDGSFKDMTEVYKYATADGSGQFEKIRNCIIGIDAEKYFKNELYIQFERSKMQRELLKCFTGFSVPDNVLNLDKTIESDNKLWIASGNWGCGVFGGNIELKCIIQWIAATLANKKLKYFGFGDKGCKYIESFIKIMKKHDMSVGVLWSYLVKYSKYRKIQIQNNDDECLSVFRFIVNNHFPDDILVADPKFDKKKKKKNVKKDKDDNKDNDNDNQPTSRL